MDGDIAPLETLAGIAERHGAFLLIDEAHATGVLGPGGRGLAHGLEGRDNVVTLHTCGKALGLSGALVCLPRVLREFLINRCRNFIFATAPSPLLAAAIRAALGVIERADDRRAALAERVRRVGEALRRLAGAEPSGTHIQPVIVGSDKRALALAERMQAPWPRHSRDTPADGAGRHGAVAHFADAERERRANRRDDRAARAELKRSPARRGRTPMSARFVIVGTDTGVGKTVFSAALAGALGAFYWKPVQAGLEEETDSQMRPAPLRSSARAHFAGGLSPRDARFAASRGAARRARHRSVAARSAGHGRTARHRDGGRRDDAADDRDADDRPFGALAPPRDRRRAHDAWNDQSQPADHRGAAASRHSVARGRLCRRGERRHAKHDRAHGARRHARSPAEPYPAECARLCGAPSPRLSPSRISFRTRP